MIEKKIKNLGIYFPYVQIISNSLKNKFSKSYNNVFPFIICWEEAFLINVIKGLLVTQDSIKKINLALLLYFQLVVFLVWFLS